MARSLKGSKDAGGIICRQQASNRWLRPRSLARSLARRGHPSVSRQKRMCSLPVPARYCSMHVRRQSDYGKASSRIYVFPILTKMFQPFSLSPQIIENQSKSGWRVWFSNLSNPSAVTFLDCDWPFFPLIPDSGLPFSENVDHFPNRLTFEVYFPDLGWPFFR